MNDILEDSYRLSTDFVGLEVIFSLIFEALMLKLLHSYNANVCKITTNFPILSPNSAAMLCTRDSPLHRLSRVRRSELIVYATIS